ncbi:MAG: hypothetical protein ACRED5_11990, partial [Propylenella sp.]
YVPVLLKPGASALAAQLWALKHKSPDLPGLAELPAVSASGRTSVAVEPSFDPELYRRFGFRIYGSRAIRIDILERLADLIRPALSWSPGAVGERPPGALDEGRCFTVTPAMTSLLGASGEDMSVVLNGLGYRMEHRPKPVEAQTVGANTPPSEAALEEAHASEPNDPAPEPPPVEKPPVVEPEIEPPAEETPIEEPRPEPPPAVEPPPEAPALEDLSTQVEADAATQTSSETTPAPEPAAEPETIEVWRLGASRPKRAPRARPERQRHAKDERQGRDDREGQDDRRRPGKMRRPEGKRRPPRGDRQEGERPLWQRPPPRERAVDPDSPFAALAALKKELEKSGGE